MTAEPLRMPVSVAARKGVSAVAATAAERRVVLTSLGRAIAVVDSAERIDEDVRALREGVRAVVEAYADAARKRSGAHTLTAVCTRLGLDEETVRRRAAQARDRA
jgi:hypothetical protein